VKPSIIKASLFQSDWRTRVQSSAKKATGTTQENYGYHVNSPSSVINNQKQVEKENNLNKHTNLIYTQNVQVSPYWPHL